MAILDNIPGWKVFSAGIGLAALCVVGWLGYRHFIATPDDLKHLQEEATEHALEQLADIYVKKVRNEGDQVLVVMPVRNDTSNGQIREMLLKRLGAIERVKADKPRDPDLEERATAVFKSLIRKDESKPDPAAVFEKSGQADEVLSVSVEKLSSGADSGQCVLDVYRIVRDDTPERKARAEEVRRIKGLSGTARAEETPADDGPGFWATLWAFLWRMVAVLGASALLPFIAWPGIKAAFKVDSNALNAGIMIGLTAADLAVLFALAGFSFSQTAVISACVLLPAALLYNFRMLNFIEER